LLILDQSLLLKSILKWADQVDAKICYGYAKGNMIRVVSKRYQIEFIALYHIPIRIYTSDRVSRIYDGTMDLVKLNMNVYSIFL
jgi:hypothetical protein